MAEALEKACKDKAYINIPVSLERQLCLEYELGKLQQAIVVR
jgi:hypothetical protein